MAAVCAGEDGGRRSSSPVAVLPCLCLCGSRRPGDRQARLLGQLPASLLCNGLALGRCCL